MFGSFDKFTSGCGVEISFVEYPGAVSERVLVGDFLALSSQAEGSGTDIQIVGGFI
jgi:hypothetical protein